MNEADESHVGLESVAAPPAAHAPESVPATEPQAIPETSAGAAQALRERLAAHGGALDEGVSLDRVPAAVLEALLLALPQPPGPRPTEDEQRAELAERVAQAHRLPRGVRQRLSEMLTTLRFDDRGRDEPALRISDAVTLLEEALPSHVLLSPDDAAPAPHPRGESYVRGNPRDLSDDEARRIAAAQLARTGYASR